MNSPYTHITEEEIHAYVDGVLGEHRRDEIDRLLETDEALAKRVSDYFSLNSMFHDRYDRVLSEPVPKRLLPSEFAETEDEAARTGAMASPVTPRADASSAASAVQPVSPGAPSVLSAPSLRKRWLSAANWPQFAGLAAALLLGIGIGVGGMASNTGRQMLASSDPVTVDQSGIRQASLSGEEAFAKQSAIAYVTYAPMVTRPVEVGADQEQELVQWLSSRLGTDVRAPILTNAGFELMGGRLLPGGEDGPVAQFMYHDSDGKRITLNISHRKLARDITSFKLYKDGPVNVFYWADGHFSYAVSGGIDRAVLLQLSHDVYAQLTTKAPRPAPPEA